MPRSHRSPRRKNKAKAYSKRKRKVFKESRLTILDKTSVGDIRDFNAKRDQLLKYHWDLYSELAYQRSQRFDELKEAFNNSKTGRYALTSWKRVLDYQHSLCPLSARGSYAGIGGRFNIGEIDVNRYVPFPGLYVGSDEDTALQEVFGPTQDSNSMFSNYEFSLRKKLSFTLVSISGEIESVIDLHNKKTLLPFVSVLKEIKIPKHINDYAKKIGYQPYQSVNTVDELLKSLLVFDWRGDSWQVDVPANSQIFGQMVASSGIEGIVYPSKYTGKPCIAIYPQNFEKSSSYITLDNQAPGGTKVTRLDCHSWEEAV